MQRNDRLQALPPLITFLATYPEPQATVEALLRGPFGHYGATACNLMTFKEPDSLVLVGTTGITERTMTRYQELPLSLDTPMGRAFKDMEPVMITITEMIDSFPAVRIDLAIWQEQLERSGGDQLIICLPVVSHGMAVGALNFYTSNTQVWTPSDFSFLNGISALLGMWISNPRTDSGFPEDVFDLTHDAVFSLNGRQLEILRLVEQGRSNAAIAVTLGYSQSTVKQELQRSMKVLRTSDRADAAKRARELGLQKSAEEKCD
ncbi:MAG: LuxR C-terminal-related transcriptional regulator [Candidatus Nanopelagicales bacterium]